MRVAVALEPIPGTVEGKSVNSHWMGYQSVSRHDVSTHRPTLTCRGNLAKTICLPTCFGRKPENLEETHANTGSICKTQHRVHVKLRLKPGTPELWSSNVQLHHPCLKLINQNTKVVFTASYHCDRICCGGIFFFYPQKQSRNNL